ncbi:MAG: hypothetical protein HYU52_13415 [Acidobacteria bacterium]|nr:hypothetical protein [Acidobacteriota bacterium]
MRSSISSSCRALTDAERGYALLSALAIAVLFFGLITLVLWESTIRHRAAQSFRARIQAQALAENAAELAARGLADGSALSASAETDAGTMAATGTASIGLDGKTYFEINAEGVARGPNGMVATVTVTGYANVSGVTITSSKHSQ